MKTFFISIGILLSVSLTAVGQTAGLPSTEEQKGHSFNTSNIEFGGSFGLTLGDYTSISVAPQVGYVFNKYFSAGTGISYNYFRYNYDDGFSKFRQSQNYLGLNLYARLRPINYIVFQVQPEGYYMWGSTAGTNQSMFVPTLLVGGGTTIPAGRGGINIMLYYDVVQYKKDGINYSPYGNQIVYSVGYVFNF